MSRARTLLLWAAATDRTFALVGQRPDRRLEGKCIFCRRRLALALDRDERHPTATVEHILPRAHGGTDALENLAAKVAAGDGAAFGRVSRSTPSLNTASIAAVSIGSDTVKLRS